MSKMPSPFDNWTLSELTDTDIGLKFSYRGIVDSINNTPIPVDFKKKFFGPPIPNTMEELTKGIDSQKIRSLEERRKIENIREESYYRLRCGAISYILYLQSLAKAVLRAEKTYKNYGFIIEEKSVEKIILATISLLEEEILLGITNKRNGISSAFNWDKIANMSPVISPELHLTRIFDAYLVENGFYYYMYKQKYGMSFEENGTVKSHIDYVLSKKMVLK